MRSGGTRRWENYIIAGILMLISAFLMGFLFDFFFDLNDDTMMRDIMAGIYSGVPDGHNMQTLYPLGAFLAFCYRLCRTVPWYGLFLFFCQFGSLYLVGLRIFSLLEKRGAQVLAFLGLMLFQWGIWLTHMVNVQYTITCAMLSAAAVFRIMTTPAGLPGKVFLFKNIPTVILVILAYQLRTEMLLLTLPFMGFAMWVCWWGEEKPFTRAGLGKYAAVSGLMLLGMILSLLLDSAAYGSEQWRDFRRFFDARTTVYDYYQEVVTDDIYGKDLEQLGVSPGKQILLRNYNFGLDEEIDTPLLEKAASYAKDKVGGERDLGGILKEKLFLYRYRTFHADDAPYNLLALAGYAANIIAIVILMYEKRPFFWHAAQLVLLALMRTSLWMFILLRGRDPERITHSLYLLEMTILVALLFRLREKLADGKHGRGGEIFLCAAAVLFLLFSAGRLEVTILSVLADQSGREQVNQDWYAIDGYCRENPEQFYFEDVYSTVAFSDKLLESKNDTIANYDIAGGWMCKSPLYREKLAHYGIGTAEEALLEGKAYFIMSEAERQDRGLDWLRDYYAEKAVNVEIEEYDRINENYRVYRIVSVSGGKLTGRGQ